MQSVRRHKLAISASGKNIALAHVLLCLIAADAHAYAPTLVRLGKDNLNNFELVSELSNQGQLIVNGKEILLWFRLWPRLDGKWQKLSYIFTPQGSGKVHFILGPDIDNSEFIPYYYADIKVNGTPLDDKPGWTLQVAKNGRTGSWVPGPDGTACLLLYHTGGASHELQVKAGERVELTMMVRAGSFLDDCLVRLAATADNLDEAERTTAQRPGAPVRETKAGKAFAQCFGELGKLMKSRLKLDVPPLEQNANSPKALKAKVLELAKACETARDKESQVGQLCLYEQPKDRDEVKNKILEVQRLAAEMKSSCLLDLIFSKP